jgi:thymidylate synthase (FAD)
MAIKLTMSKQINVELPPVSEGMLGFIDEAGHGSVMEHEMFTFALEGVSRSFLAQITRHRTGKFTSASQHYANYADMPMIVHPDATFKEAEIIDRAFDAAMTAYEELIELGYPGEEARQVLPNACATNIIWTIDGRNLLNFLSVRLCKRNVAEMCITSDKILDAMSEAWPELYQMAGPPCYLDTCNQGKMGCGKAWTTEDMFNYKLKRTK